MNTNPQAKRILCYGDSNTRGVIPGTEAQRYSIDKRWCGILQNKLGLDYEVIEEGLDGRTTNQEFNLKNGLRYLPAVLETNLPLNIVIFYLGTNDLKIEYQTTAEEIADGLKKLVNLARVSLNTDFDLDNKIIILTPPLIKENSRNLALEFKDTRIKSSQLVTAFKSVADKTHSICLDLNQYLDASDIDGIHLDLEAHQKLGNL